MIVTENPLRMHGVDNPLSSAALRFSLFPRSSASDPGPRETRPFGLWHTESFPAPHRPPISYCHRLQVAVDEAGQPLARTFEDAKFCDKDDKPDPKPKEWESKTYSDGDEGQEEDSWGWEEQ